MQKNQIINQLVFYTIGKVSAIELEEWVVSHLQEALDSGDTEVIGLFDEVDALLLELGETDLDEEQFMTAIDALLRSSVETVQLDLPAFEGDVSDEDDIKIEAAKGTVSSSYRREADLTGRAVEVRLSHAFA